MLDHVPPLVAKKPGLAVRATASLSKSVRSVTAQIKPYTHWWSNQNQSALDGDGPLLLVIGDSTAIGVGASHPSNGYVGRLLAALDHENRTRQPWRAINLAQSGAKFEDGLNRQLPNARKLPRPDLAVCCLGTNDLVWGMNTASLRSKARALVGEVGELADRSEPLPTIVCSVAGGSSRARMVNRAIRAAAEDAKVAFVNPWNEPGPGPSKRLASDRFHPNDLGYALMAKPIGRHLGVEVGEHRWNRSDRDGGFSESPQSGSIAERD